MRTIQDMVQQEILCCMSSIVNTLAGGYGHAIGADGRGNGRLRDLEALCEQAMELASPVQDYEEAATQAGFTVSKDRTGAFYWHNIGNPKDAGGQGYGSAERAYQSCLEDNNLEPYEWEVYEHWSVSTWFAEQLEKHGEKVDTDFAGMNVWARTTIGQAIHADGAIERIYAAMMQPAQKEEV